MSASQHRVSVIIPMKDSQAYILAALRSIAAQKTQPLEILVVDDGSSDNSRDIVSSYMRANRGVSLLDGPGKGPGPARNVGLRRAAGDFIAFLDSDDLWPADKLELQLARFERAPPVDVVSGFVQYFADHPDIDLRPNTDSLLEDMFHVHLGSSIFRKNVFDRLGLFEESFLYSEDVDLILRIRDSDTPMVILDHITLYYRRHGASMTSQYTVSEKRDFHRALLRSMARRKKNGELKPLTPFRSLVEKVPEP